MQRLRTTFTRSRTPTGAEMKMQNSLEVPKQVRSASFDEMQLETQRTTSHLLKKQSSSSADERSSDAGLLQVPQTAHAQRSHSFDSAAGSAGSAGSDDSGTFLEVPRNMKSRRSSSTKTPPPCIHCYYLEQYQKQLVAEQRHFIEQRELSALTCSYTSSEQSDDDDADDGDRTTCVDDIDATVGSADNDLLEDDEDDDDDDAAVEMDIHIRSSIDESRTRLPRQMRRHTIGSSVTTSEDEGLEESEHESPHFGNTLLPPAPTTPCGITFTLSPTNGDYAPFPHAFPIDLGTPPPSPALSPCISASPLLELPPPLPESPLELLPISAALELTLPPPPAFCTTPCTATATTSITTTTTTDTDDALPPLSPSTMRPRRRSISRQEAIFVEPTGNSLENVSHEEELKSSVDTADSIDDASNVATYGSPTATKHVLVVRDIYLTVPDLRRDRAASVDSCFSKLSSGNKTEELQPSEDGSFLTVPNINATRSRSVDIVLPTDEQARYKALAMTGASGIYGDGIPKI